MQAGGNNVEGMGSACGLLWSTGRDCEYKILSLCSVQCMKNNKQIKNTTFLHPRFTFEFRVCKYFCHVQDGKCLLTGATVLFQSGLSCSFISITEHAQTCTMLQDVAYFVQQAGKITVRANQKYSTGPREMCRYSPCPWKSVIKRQPLIHSLCKTKEK